MNMWRVYQFKASWWRVKAGMVGFIRHHAGVLEVLVPGWLPFETLSRFPKDRLALPPADCANARFRT